jgi:hypothetical protein
LNWSLPLALIQRVKPTMASLGPPATTIFRFGSPRLQMAQTWFDKYLISLLRYLKPPHLVWANA